MYLAYVPLASESSAKSQHIKRLGGSIANGNLRERLCTLLKLNMDTQNEGISLKVFRFNYGNFGYPAIFSTLPETNIAHGKSTILMVFTRKDGDFPWAMLAYQRVAMLNFWGVTQPPNYGSSTKPPNFTKTF